MQYRGAAGRRGLARGLSPAEDAADRALPLPVAAGSRGQARVPRGERARFHGAGRAADPRPVQGRGAHRAGGRDAGARSQQALPAHLLGGEERALRDRDRRRDGVDGRRCGEHRPAHLSEHQGAERALHRRGRDDRAHRDAFRRPSSAPHDVRQPHAGARAAARRPLSRARDRSERSRLAARRARHRRELHGEPAADHRQGPDRERAEGAQASPDADAGPRGAARRGGRGRQARRRLPLHGGRPGPDRARGHGLAAERGGAGRGDHREPGHRFHALARQPRAGADDTGAARLGRARAPARAGAGGEAPGARATIRRSSWSSSRTRSRTSSCTRPPTRSRTRATTTARQLAQMLARLYQVRPTE